MTTTETAPDAPAAEAPAGAVETVVGADLIGMLADVLRSTGTDKAIPAITLVRLHTTTETADGEAVDYLHAWATDRYVAAHARVAVRGQLTEPVWLYRDALDQLTKVGRKALTVTIMDHRTALRDGGMVSFNADSVAVDAEVAAFGGVPIANVCDDALPEKHDRETWVQPQFLQTIAAVAKRRKAYVVLTPGKNGRPLHVSVGPDYRAWVVPLRRNGAAADWLPNSWDAA